MSKLAVASAAAAVMAIITALGASAASVAAAALVAVCVAMLVAFFHNRHMLRTFTSDLSRPLPPSLRVDGVEAFISDRDAAEAPLKPDNGSQLIWAEAYRNQQAPRAVVLIHGWSASPLEVDPVDLRIAEEFGAHLLRFRLTGHGLDAAETGERMLATARRQALFKDAATALALGKLLGRRVILIGVSMGGGMSTWLASRPWARPELAALILVSPAYGINGSRAPVYDYLKWFLRIAPLPISRRVLHAVNGPINRVGIRKSPSQRQRQARAWTMVYPTECALNVIDVFLTVELSVDARQLQLPVFVLRNPRDPVTNEACLQRVLRAAPSIYFEDVTDSEEPHNVTGAILSPSTVDRSAAHLIEWLHQHKACLGFGSDATAQS